MMNNGSYGQFQRGTSCSQGRTPACGHTQPQRSASCSPQQRPAGPCSPVPPKPAPPCNQMPPRPQKPVGPSCPCSQMNREQLLHWITLTKFACVDSALYLDTHPEDLEAIQYFQEHSRLYNEALEEYSKTYGPLTLAHAHHCDTYWDWVNQPWPWQ